MKVPTAVKAILEKEKFGREEHKSYGQFIDTLAEILVDFYNEKYAKSAEHKAHNSTKNVEK